MTKWLIMKATKYVMKISNKRLTLIKKVIHMHLKITIRIESNKKKANIKKMRLMRK